MNAAQAEDSSDVIMGNLSINDVPAKVLFDTGASIVLPRDLLHLSMGGFLKLCISH